MSDTDKYQQIGHQINNWIIVIFNLFIFHFPFLPIQPVHINFIE